VKLSKRTPRFSLRACREHRALRAFHAPQREHVKQPMPPRKPVA
jgi:hypothetical protein